MVGIVPVDIIGTVVTDSDLWDEKSALLALSLCIVQWLIAKSKFTDWLLTAAALTGSYSKYRYLTDSLPACALTDVLICSRCIALSDYLHQLHWKMIKAGGLFSDSLLHMIWLIACIGCIDWLLRACVLSQGRFAAEDARPQLVPV